MDTTARQPHAVDVTFHDGTGQVYVFADRMAAELFVAAIPALQAEGAEGFVAIGRAVIRVLAVGVN